MPKACNCASYAHSERIDTAVTDYARRTKRLPSKVNVTTIAPHCCAPGGKLIWRRLICSTDERLEAYALAAFDANHWLDRILRAGISCPGRWKSASACHPTHFAACTGRTRAGTRRE